MEKFDALRIDGHTLRVFLTVCETRSVSRTADAFDLNQSTISHTIDKMRLAVGDPLFVKSGRGITPTEKAITIIPRVQEILAGIEGLFEETEYDPAQDVRPIVVAVPTPALMPEMKAAHAIIREAAPRMLFQVTRLAPRERLAEILTLGEADVAVAINATKIPATLNSVRYGEDRLVVYYDPARRGPVESIEDYAKATHAVADFGGKTKSVVEEALEKRRMHRTIGFAAPTASSLGETLIGTDMLATMPKGLARGAYSGLAYCDPPVKLPPLAYDLVWHRRFEHSGRNIWIRRILLENAPQSEPTPSAQTVTDLRRDRNQGAPETAIRPTIPPS